MNPTGLFHANQKKIAACPDTDSEICRKRKHGESELDGVKPPPSFGHLPQIGGGSIVSLDGESLVGV